MLLNGFSMVYIEGKEFYIHMLLCIILFLLGFVRFWVGWARGVWFITNAEETETFLIDCKPPKKMSLIWIE